MRIIDYKKIGPHEIFVIKIDKSEPLESYVKQVQDKVQSTIGGNAKALITDKTRRILQYYIDKNFEYFVLDFVRTSRTTVERFPIQYTFKSDAAFYPLVISRMGGSPTNTKVSLIIITSGKLTEHRGLQEQHIRWTSSAILSEEELSRFNQSMANLFSGNSTARIFEISKFKLNEFPADMYVR